MKSNWEYALQLLDQIIEKNIYDDFKKNNGEKTGVDWNIHHLNVLKKTILEIYNAR